MPENPFVRGPGPPTRGKVRLPQVVWPLPGEALVVTLLSDQIVAYWTHWLPKEGQTKGGTKLCVGLPSCHYDHGALPIKWCGYIAARTEKEPQDVVALLTEEGARSLMRATAGQTALRGLVVKIARGQGPTNGVVSVTLERSISPRALPREFAVGPSLRAVWQLPALPELMADYSHLGERGEP